MDSRQLPLKVLCKAGLARRLLRKIRGAPVILTYHGVTDEKGRGIYNFDGKHVHVDLFRRHLAVLSRSRRLVELAELVDALRTGGDTRGMLAITFDDGYRDNQRCAAAVLSDYNVPASFFVATGFIGSPRWAWTDRLEAAFDAATEGTYRIDPLGESVSLNGGSSRLQALWRVKRVLKTVSWQRAEAQAQQIEAALNVELPEPFGIYQFMSWDEVRELKHAGFDIGAHTVNHAILSRVPSAEAQMEIISSMERVVDEVGLCSPVFCYPNGKRTDYNEEVLAICRGKFDGALSTEFGAARPGELYELRRVVVDGATSDYRLASLVVSAD